MVGVGIYPFDEKPIDVSLQTDWKQQRHTVAVDLKGRKGIEAVT
jgi:hypothetical protein